MQSFEESIVPDLQKLGLSDKIPKLKEALIKEYKKDDTNSEIHQGIDVSLISQKGEKRNVPNVT